MSYVSLLVVRVAVHADDIITFAASKSSITKKTAIISDFTDSSCLNLNIQKLDVL